MSMVINGSRHKIGAAMNTTTAFSQRQEELKYSKSHAMELLKSSIDLGWSTLTADLRSHSRYDGLGAAAPADAEVGIIVRGSEEGFWRLNSPEAGNLRGRRRARYG